MAALASLSAVVRPWSRRAGALAVAVALAGATMPSVSLAAPDQAEVERLYVEGQELNEKKDYKGAAQVWTRLLNRLEESGDNQELRESLIINILEAHLAAYNQVLDSNGKKDPAHIFAGKATLDQYYGDFQRVHGDRKAISAAVQEVAAEMERLYEELVDSTGSETAGESESDSDDDSGPPPATTDTLPPPPPPNNGDNGLGLILGGAGLGVLGIGAVVLIPVGSALGKEAEDDYNDASATSPVDQDGIEDAERKGERANAILIAGAVAAPLLLGGAAVLIALGIKKRKGGSLAARPRDTVRASPAIGRTFSGVTISGRF